MSKIATVFAVTTLPLPAFADACARAAHASTGHAAGSTVVHWLAPAFVGIVLSVAWRHVRRR